MSRRARVLTLLASAAIVLGALVVGIYAWLAPALPELERCAEPLDLVADDGARLPGVLYRCGPERRDRPGLLVWPDDPRAARGWAANYASWALEGGVLLVMRASPRPGLAARDLAAGIELLAAEPDVDAGRVAVVLEKSALAALEGPAALGAGEPQWPEGASALVLCRPAGEHAPLVDAMRALERPLLVPDAEHPDERGPRALARHLWSDATAGLPWCAGGQDWIARELDAPRLARSSAESAAGEEGGPGEDAEGAQAGGETP